MDIGAVCTIIVATMGAAQVIDGLSREGLGRKPGAADDFLAVGIRIAGVGCLMAEHTGWRPKPHPKAFSYFLQAGLFAFATPRKVMVVGARLIFPAGIGVPVRAGRLPWLSSIRSTPLRATSVLVRLSEASV